MEEDSLRSAAASSESGMREEEGLRGAAAFSKSVPPNDEHSSSKRSSHFAVTFLQMNKTTSVGGQQH
ncbi:hypothetical protein AB6A40_007835 [Gnathostoma spinigerum]|uniref:Uncharacterized protein n=1 Tax=Gnathostoma spinigerum TaxID=75299 RepID=A0ABD6EMX3_9BILA